METVARSDIHELSTRNDGATWRALANAVAVGVNVVGPATTELSTALSHLAPDHAANDALARLVHIADAWLRNARVALESERPAETLRGLSAMSADAVAEWLHTDGRTVYRTAAARRPWPSARRLADAIVAADEIVGITTGIILDEYLRRAVGA